MGRLACVANHFVRAENPGEVIANTYCAPDVIRSQFPSIREFEVHYLTRFDMGDGTEANNWIRVRSGEVTIRGESQGDAIILQNDINTAPESAEDGDFNVDEIRVFAESAAASISDSLTLHVAGLGVDPD